MTKAKAVIREIQQQYHFSLYELYKLFPELRRLEMEEELEQIKLKARATRFALIGK